MAANSVDSDQYVDGSVDNVHLAGSIANAKLANSSITVSDGSNTSGISLGGTLTFSGTNNEIEVAESSDDFKFNSETDNQLNFAIKLLNG